MNTKEKGMLKLHEENVQDRKSVGNLGYNEISNL